MTAQEINRLFTEVEHLLNSPTETGRRERWIFEQAIGESADAISAMWRFTRDVTTCPDEVITFCQALLAPGGLESYHLRAIANMTHKHPEPATEEACDAGNLHATTLGE